MSTCRLDEAPFYQCCCNCKHRLKRVTHCAVHGKPEGHEGCGCGIFIDYVCAGFARDGFVHADWHEHAVGCELYSPIKIVEAP